MDSPLFEERPIGAQESALAKSASKRSFMSIGTNLTVKSPDSSQDGIGLKSMFFTKCSGQFFCAEHGTVAHYVPSHLEKILLRKKKKKPQRLFAVVLFQCCICYSKTDSKISRKLELDNERDGRESYYTLEQNFNIT